MSQSIVKKKLNQSKQTYYIANVNIENRLIYGDAYRLPLVYIWFTLKSAAQLYSFFDSLPRYYTTTLTARAPKCLIWYDVIHLILKKKKSFTFSNIVKQEMPVINRVKVIATTSYLSNKLSVCMKLI